MGFYLFLAKLGVFMSIVFLSYVVIDLIVSSAGLLITTVPGFQNYDSTPFVHFSSEVLIVVTAVLVVILFTIPLTLSLFGHAGPWLKHVASKSAKYLGAALLFAFALVVTAASTGVVADIGAFGWDGIPMLAEAILLGVLIGTLLLAFLSPSRFLRGMGRATDSILQLSHQMVHSLSLRNHRTTAIIELSVMPAQQIREKEKPDRIRAETVRFQRFIQTISALAGRVEFRLRFREDGGIVLISVSKNNIGHDDLQQRALAIVKSYLPEFRAEPRDHQPRLLGAFEDPNYYCSLRVSGVPESVENPLEPLSRYFLENNYAGDYNIILERVTINRFTKLAARREQMTLAKRSGGQETREVVLQPGQRSTNTRDYVEEVKLEESVRRLERYHSKLALRCWVYITGCATSRAAATSVAEGASSVFVGALSSQRSISALKIIKVRSLVSGPLETEGRPTILLPSEAVPYLWIPQHALGGSAVVPSAEFELPQRLEGDIELGRIVVQSTTTTHRARLHVDSLVKHAFYTGMTGSGKTTSCFKLLLQLYQLGIPFLVIEPVKSEYRTLLSSISNLQVFTPGDEDTAPFRLNIFEPPPATRVQTHLENLEAAWNASFVMYAPLPYVVKEVLAETYRTCGWDVRNNKRGKPITLDDFIAQSEIVSRRLGYEPKVLMDIEAALKTRIKSLTFGGKGPLFNTIASTPIESVLRRPTIVELEHISNNEEKAFVGAMVLNSLIEHLEARGPSKQLRHVTMIEEAHRLLPNISTQKGDPEGTDPRKAMVEQFANMLAEVRAYGEGLVLVEQIPTKILTDAIKNTGTKIAHRVPAADDREVLAGSMNLTKEQSSVFTALKPGEAIISLLVIA